VYEWLNRRADRFDDEVLGIKEENSSLQTARDELQERNSALKEQCLAQSKLVDERQEELERSSSEFEGMRTKVIEGPIFARTARHSQFTVNRNQSYPHMRA
jgi:chromosome segregation ATPase